MSRERIEELWLKRLSAETLTPAEDRELLEALKQDPKLVGELRADERTESLLRLAGRKQSDEERFLRRFESRVAAETDGPRFVQRVEARVRPGTRRAVRQANPWRIPLVAAAAILTLIAILILRSDDPRPQPVVQQPARTADPLPAPPQALPVPPPPPKPEDDDLRARTDAELKRAVEESARRPVPEVKVPKPEEPRVDPPPPPPPPAKEPEKPEPTRTVAATVVATKGKVALTGSQGRTPAAAGTGLPSGSGVESLDGDSSAIVVFPDGTRVEIRPNTAVRDILDGERGKRITVDKGEIRATVAKQPKDLPMVFTTPHAEATVLGTTLRLIADADQKKGTRLEVEEGKVRLKQLLGGKTVDVVTGHMAVAVPGATPVVRPSRLRNGLVALYSFTEGEGRVVRDVSGTGMGADLRIGAELDVDFRWIKPRGLVLMGGSLAKGNFQDVQSVRAESTDKLVEAFRKSGEFTVELWIVPGSFQFVRQDVLSANIVAFEHPTTGATNFALMQVGTSQSARRYSTRTNLQGSEFARAFGAVDLRLTHLAVTRNAAGVSVFWVNGVAVGTEKPPLGVSAWEMKQTLSLGGAVGGNNPWRGEFHSLAFYDRALAPEDVVRNFRAGVD